MNDDDTQPSEMPPQPKTKEIPAASPIEIALAEISREVRGARADIQLVSNDLSIVKERVGIIESWKNEQDARVTRTSAGVRSLSSTDEQHASAIARVTEKVEAVDAKTDALSKSNEVQLAILTRLDKIASNPNVKIILAVAATALASWAASKGLR